MPTAGTLGFRTYSDLTLSRGSGHVFFHPRSSIFGMPASRRHPTVVLAVYTASAVREGLSSQSSFGHVAPKAPCWVLQGRTIPSSGPCGGDPPSRPPCYLTHLSLPRGKESHPLQYSWASPVAQLGKNLPAMQETWVRSLGWEDALEKRKATHSSILACIQSMGSQRVGFN